MNKLLQKFSNEIVELEISGGKFLKGTMIDIGSEIVVLFNGSDYLYVPIEHIQHLSLNNDNGDEIDKPSEPPTIISNKEKEDLTLTQVLTQAQGMYTEIYVTGKTSLHGYISNIMNNYIVFQSPIYKTMFIALKHLKWLIPYSFNQKPYELADQTFSIQPYNEPLSNNLEIQVEHMKNELVVINIGEKSNYIGKIIAIEGEIVEIKTARTNSVYLNLNHFKTIHLV
ncbi:DUF2642 domain-containing protein [Rummeliibacillus pycnus]|uniref:DUF2642 domain-containing protein n=1 Tax=Rummeliibacillus pycnus TaxID=101070 RepID=UPI000C9A8A9A|nr:DUF2642 domain-containing protein [Rummeliibacillus pycnus]